MAERKGEITPSDALVAVQAVAAAGGVSQAAAMLGMTRAAVQRRVRRAEAWGITAHGEVMASPARRLDAPKGRPARYLFTAAQSNTKAHPGFWANLLALAAHYGARIMVARVRYNHSASQVAGEKVNRAADETLWYDEAFTPYLCDERVEVAPGLIWAGDMNIIPSAVQPLSGLDSFTGAASCIFPHPQIALRSVATAPGTPTKMNYTTGAATLKNYIKRKAGLKAEFHHAFGALLVEVEGADWWVRQVNAAPDGAIHDLDVAVAGGVVSTGNRVAVLTPGDIHGTKADAAVIAAVWGDGGMVDALRPEAQVLHDVLDFGSRSHHGTVFDRIAAHYDAAESVEGEIAATAALISRLARPGVKTYVAKGNHDEHLDRWVRDAEWRRDPVNAAFYLAAASAVVEGLRAGVRDFDLAAWALRRAGVPDAVIFLPRDERLEIAGIRHDLHGDLGPNGARGSVANLARIGAKANVGHSHSAGIVQGCYQAGTFSRLAMGYNRGPSSWSHSAIVTYADGKRAIITIRNGKWRASA